MVVVKGGVVIISVDLVSRSLEKMIENFRINGINFEEYDIVVEDIFFYFK